jgi:hypothetical protein
MTYSRPWMYSGLFLMTLGAASLLRQGPEPKAHAEPPTSQTTQPAKSNSEPNSSTRKSEPGEWRDLFDGKTLAGWKTPRFGGEGKVFVKDGRIVIEMGSMMSGIAWAGRELLRDNYELTLEGMRLDGSDFFCTTTFPVGKDSCSLVVGGWGGALVGLSSIDHADASENSTMKTRSFKNDKWYPIRIRVSDAAIEAWIEGEKTVDQPRKDHQIGIRMECDLCRPLGISTWCTSGAVRAIRVRPLSAEEVRAIGKEHAKQAKQDF